MDEFPDPDEEFDLIETVHQEAPKRDTENIKQNKSISDVSLRQEEPKTVSQLDSVPSSVLSESLQNGASVSTESTKKRNFDELFGDISDLLGPTDFSSVPCRREKRPRWDEPEAVIQLILEERKKHHAAEEYNSALTKASNFESLKDSISTRVPRWNFIALTRSSDSQRIYLRIKETKKKHVQNSVRPMSGLLSVPYSQMKAEAEEIIQKNEERAKHLPPAPKHNAGDQLWVDKYRPKSYIELLSDESVNRAFLRWMKLWDKVVFHREVIKRKKPPPPTKFGFKKKFQNQPDEEVDSKGFPIHRIVLLSGPPGLGKTTLAHLVAKHAGYNVVEVNASDDRGPEAFSQALLASTKMRSLMTADPKPNCLILDEIDGAPAASIDLLIKFVQGKLVAKGRKAKESAGKKSDGCKRPIVCICNEAYTPSLRNLRTMAYLITVPKVSPARLADRLAMIARKERIEANQDALLQLAERSGCDVRACLCALQYMGGASINTNMHMGLKDTRRGLFDSWRDVFQIPMNRAGLLSNRNRVQLVLKAAQSGETERLVQGVFHNYPEIAPPKIDVISKCLEWFQFYDKIMTLIMTRQDWRLMPYTNYAFVSWHFGFAISQAIKLTYPYAMSETNQKRDKNIELLKVTKRAYGRDTETLALDIIPFLPELLCPRLRPVSLHLYSAKERTDLSRVIHVMIDLGLTFTQVKNEVGGSFDYILEPNLYEISIFPGCKVRRAMPYTVKQIVYQELEAERLKKDVANIDLTSKKQVEMPAPAVPNHLKQLKPMPVQPKETKYRNFFENFLPKNNSSKQKSPGSSPKGPKAIHRIRQIMTKYGVWYKYTEGFSNSVRRDVKMSSLL